MSRGHLQSRTCYGKKTLKRRTTKGDADDVVLIDVDSDSSHNVIVIDVPESVQQKLRGSNGKKTSLPSIISLDDDDDDDESTNDNHPKVGAQGRGDLDSDATSSKRSSSASSQSKNPVDENGDECQVIRERNFPVKLSKCKRTYSGKASCSNRYGLDTDSESDSSDSDSSDCEVMEDSFGKVHEQWKRASMRKKNDIHNGQSGFEDQVSPFRSHMDTQVDIGAENTSEQHPGSPVCSGSRNVNSEQENLSNSIPTVDGNQRHSPPDPDLENSFAHVSFNVNPEKFSSEGAGSRKKADFSHEKGDVQFRGETYVEDPGYGNPEFCNEEKTSEGPSLWSSKEKVGNFSDVRTFEDKEGSDVGDPCLSYSQPSINIHLGHSKPNVRDKEASTFKSHNWGEPLVNHDRVVSWEKDDESFQAHPSCSERSSFTVEVKAVSGDPLLSEPQPSGKAHVNFNATPSEDKVHVDRSFCNTSLWGKSEDNSDQTLSQEKEKHVSEELFMCNSHHSVTQIKQGTSLVGARDPVTESMHNSEQQDGHAQDNDVMPAVQSDIINEREKLKETAEYKRAAEEEWAARQIQLKIQAEESQRLRKRKKAESMRLLDMERKQKQRLEEMRETQKKDEENMNLKEQIRVEIRKELYKLETKCIDMASLLRGLGVHVGGGVYPLSHEVHAAYKRALLRFHPDRASRSNIHQQVEAEEKFKLISRMKEKLL